MHNLLLEFIEKHITLSEEEKNIITSANVFKSVKKKTILLNEGQRSNEGYFVLKGCLRDYQIIDGEERTTAFYTEMEGVTPHCVQTKKPSQYYIAAVEDSIITLSNTELEAEMFEKFPKFESLCRVLSEKIIVKQQTDFAEFRTSSPEQRYLNLLENRPDLIQRVPQHQLASYLGMKPQSLSRLRTRIAKKGA